MFYSIRQQKILFSVRTGDSFAVLHAYVNFVMFGK